MDLIIKQLSKHYDGTKIFADLQAELHSGRAIGLLGPNGAGKTTLLKILTTLQKPTHGAVYLNGTNIITHPKTMQAVLGYLPQKVPYFPNLTAQEYLTYLASMKGMTKQVAQKQIAQLLQRVHLSQVGQKRLQDFSGGMRQRVGIAAALLNEPAVVIADEPTTGLDPEERVTLRNLLAELARDHLVLLSTHIVLDVEAIASQILILHKDRFLYQGAPNTLIQKAQGFVWAYPVTSELPAMSQYLTQDTSTLVQKPEGIQIREITQKPRQKEAQQVLPTLEEAYLGMLKGVVPL
ncbi:ATP-binding cassette domain-containing protein [Lactobacillus sp. CC-MHH1034]|uniref:ATP-binding cassette domain-containing protein n=1 Tax=Agrilactobacillus fermenti TaxID=2586909 RepID=UPI001E3AD27B|nr:ATP-binding cassette domain-containing protein [Agrilactobacillus fermenti]MCD2255669.1 ATP-binding cassette domain-containing protein [Agrilactobacillus fermenti]